MLFKITNEVVLLKEKEGYDSRYVIEEAFNFLYDYNIKAVELNVKGSTLKLDKDYDTTAAYNKFREMQASMVEEASKNISSFDDKISYPYEIVTPLTLEILDDVSLLFSVDEAINFVNKFDLPKAKLKYENKSIILDQESELYNVINKLKTNEFELEK